MTSVGFDRETGKIVVGWPRVLSSIRTILSTEIGERIQRRDFGSGIPPMIDRPQTPEHAIDLILAVAEALEPRRVGAVWYGEPCFSLDRVEVDLSQPANPIIKLSGFEVPDGHLGDFSSSHRINKVSFQV